uniref:GOLGA2L5 domain-containing protein n=1 Tax=Steinernema glaseri TaxID=37863 RepID=A0A1I7Y9B3_9BILA
MSQALKDCLCWDSAIIRPIAFRPLPKKASEPVDRQSITSESSSFCLKSNRSDSPTQNNKRSSRTLNATFVQPSRPKPIYQPSTSTASTSNGYKPAQQPKVVSVRDENDYDTVPEYLDRDKCLSEGESNNSDYSMIYPYQSQFMANRRSHQPSLPSPPASHKKAHHSSHHNVYGSNASSSSRNSSGIHVTPSPSDSGIVDFESLMRDKESELSQIRSTMEHNEEAVVRVYQEKERQWREQLAEVKQKLQASQQGEHALRLQVQKSNEQRDQLLSTIHALTNDKNALEKKCTTIERELNNLKTRFDQLNYLPSTNCENCTRRSSIVSTYENASRPKPKPPVPAPRASKEQSSSDRDIRSEMEDLRSEITTLKSQLNGQMTLFQDERRRWESERNLNGSSPNNNTENVLRPTRLQENNKRCAVMSQDRLI